ncbi:type II toxin-antitoxin system PrlF family antitoxin [Tistrella mobilis]|uniref:type II toxin-antitoxin system PrlF family antitoxin n=1 Tax=Tistrella mobilis TaxID=171437 RepID=UPI0035573CC4
MNDSTIIERTCKVSSKGQTTLPLTVRQILGVRDGGKIVVRADGNRIIIEPAETEHQDPAIGAFLKLISDDIAAARNIAALPDDLLQTLRQALKEVDVDLDEPIEGDVCL